MNTPPTPGTPASESEIENLLAQMSEGGEARVPAADPLAEAQVASSDRHLFPRHSYFSDNEFRKLKARHEEFVNALAGRLSLHFGVEVVVNLLKFDTLTFKEFTDSLAIPTHVTLLKLEPFGGTCLLDIPPQLGLSMVDRELGASTAPSPTDEPREIGRIEARLLSKIVSMIATEWCAAWNDLVALRPALLKYETNARFLKTHPADATLLALGLEMQIGDQTGLMQLAVPHEILEPLLQKLATADEQAVKPAAAKPAAAVKWSPLFDDITVSVSAELSEVEVTARQLAELKPGDVIPIPPALASQVRLSLAGTPKFTGTLGTDNGLWAVKIDQPLRDAQG